MNPYAENYTITYLTESRFESESGFGSRAAAVDKARRAAHDEDGLRVWVDRALPGGESVRVWDSSNRRDRAWDHPRER